MTYYRASDFVEAYYTEFADIEGGSWKISIQIPGHSGLSIGLMPAANPFEWMGNTDTSQTKCIQGSTGYIRVINDGVNDFTPGGVLPTEINNRRVVVTRGGNTVWIGYIKCEEYQQDMYAINSEIEIPVCSMLEVMGSIPLPPLHGDIAEPNGHEVGDLFRFACQLVGSGFTYIVTNFPYYEDYKGQRYSGTCWTQNEAYIYNFYNIKNGVSNPCTLKEMLEAFLHPYGRAREFGGNLFILMDSAGFGRFYSIGVESTGVDRNLFIEGDVGIPSINLSDISFKSTNVKKSIIPKPKSVSYEMSVDDRTTILELHPEMIKGTFDFGAGNLISYTDSNTSETQIFYKKTVNIGEDYIIMDNFINPIENHEFGRGFLYTVNSSDVNHFVSRKEFPLGIFATSNGVDIIPIMPVRTRKGYYKLRLTIKLFSTQYVFANGQTICVIKWGSNKYYNVFSNTWQNTSVENDIRTEEYVVDFALPSDNITSEIVISLKSQNDLESTYIGLKLEYIEDNVVRYLNQIAINDIKDAYEFENSKEEIGGTGEEIEVSYKTLAGHLFYSKVKGGLVPFCGFNDCKNYFDKENRRRIDIEEAAVSGYPIYFANEPCFVEDGSVTYIPIGVGMNARNCTTKLCLVQTNLGQTNN